MRTWWRASSLPGWRRQRSPRPPRSSPLPGPARRHSPHRRPLTCRWRTSTPGECPLSGCGRPTPGTMSCSSTCTGGGYIWMTPRAHLPAIGGLVRATGAACLAVDYRRAPEHPYPAPVDDVVAVYRGSLWPTAWSPSGWCPSPAAPAWRRPGPRRASSRSATLGVELPVGAVCFSPSTDLHRVRPLRRHRRRPRRLRSRAADDGLALPRRRRPDVADGLTPVRRPRRPTAHPDPCRDSRESLLDDSRRFVHSGMGAGRRASSSSTTE